MVNFSTMKEEYSLYEIDNEIFVKVLSYDDSNGATNVDIFYKVNNRYRMVAQTELPRNIVNVIATKPSRKMTEEEITHFKSFIEEQNISETASDVSLDKVIFGKILHNNYIMSKNPDKEFYRVSMAISNEFGIMSHTTPVLSTLVPYIFADIVNLGNKFKENLFLIDNNVFVQTFEYKNRNMGLIFQFEMKDEEKASVTVLGIFGIQKDFKGEIKILSTQEDLKFVHNMKIITDEQIQKFLEKLSLQKI